MSLSFLVLGAVNACVFFRVTILRSILYFKSTILLLWLRGVDAFTYLCLMIDRVAGGWIWYAVDVWEVIGVEVVPDRCECDWEVGEGCRCDCTGKAR